MSDLPGWSKLFFIVIVGARGLQMSAVLAIFADETINHDKNYL